MNEKIHIPTPKRTFDIIISLFFIVILSPLYLLIIISLIIEQLLRRKIPKTFYIEKRISQGEKFTFVKFNIFKPNVVEEMKHNNIFIHTKLLEAEKKNLLFVGNLLKHTYLDELPQLLTVLKGDMSLVGPRPTNIEVYKKHQEQGNILRYAVKAGLTGNFQSQKGMNVKNEYELDNEYVEFCKTKKPYKIIWLDVKILCKTMKVMVRAKGI